MTNGLQDNTPSGRLVIVLFLDQASTMSFSFLVFKDKTCQRSHFLVYDKDLICMHIEIKNSI